MPRFLRVILPVVLGVFVMSGVAMVWLMRRGPELAGGSDAAAAALARPGLDHLSIPEFSLIDQDGKPFGRDNLKGHMTILDVVFTNCPLACPMMTEKMNALAESLADVPSIRFVSLYIDPQRDTPARIREYIELHDIKPETRARWFHLTDASGSDASARAIVEQGLKSVLEEDRSIPVVASDGTRMFNIRHPTWFFLLGPDVKVRDIYQSSVDDEMVRLGREARRVARDGGG